MAKKRKKYQEGGLATPDLEALKSLTTNSERRAFLKQLGIAGTQAKDILSEIGAKTPGTGKVGEILSAIGGVEEGATAASTALGQASAVGTIAETAKTFVDPLEKAITGKDETVGGDVAKGALGGVGKGATMGATIGALGGPIGMGAGAAIGAGVGAVSGLIKGQKGLERRRKERVAESISAAAAGSGRAEGGKIKGPGGPKSDSIKTTMNEGDFIVPAENAGVAEKLRKLYLGGTGNEVSPLAKGGKVPVAVSNGEHRFTAQEVLKLQSKGIDLNALAPNAEPGNKLAKGGSADGGGDINAAKAAIESAQLRVDNAKAAYGGADSRVRQAESELRKAEANLKKLERTAVVESNKAERQVLETAINEQLTGIDDRIDSLTDQIANARSPEQRKALQDQRSELTFNKRQLNDAKVKIRPAEGVKGAEAPIGRDAKNLASARAILGQIGAEVPPAEVAPSPTRKAAPVGPTKERSAEILSEIASLSRGDLAKTPEVQNQIKLLRNELEGKIPVAGPAEDPGQIPFLPGQEPDDTFKDPGARFPSEFDPFYVPPEQQAEQEKKAKQSGGGAEAATKREIDEAAKEAAAEKAKIEALTPMEPRGFDTGVTPSQIELIKGATIPTTPAQDRKGVREARRAAGHEGIDPLTAIGAAQTGLGLATALTDKRPEDEISPELRERFRRAVAEEKFGLSPARRTLAERRLETAEATQQRAILQTAPSAGAARANLALANVGAGEAHAELAARDQELAMAKSARADRLAGVIEDRRRQIFTDSLRGFEQRQSASAALTQAGLKTIYGRQREKEVDRLLKETAKAGQFNQAQSIKTILENFKKDRAQAATGQNNNTP